MHPTNQYAATIAIAIIASTSVPTYAVVLSEGVASALPGTTSAANPNLAGVVVEDRVRDFDIDLGGRHIHGTIQDRVVHAADGTYDFYWRVINGPNSAASIQSFRIGEFIHPVLDANWRIDGLGTVAPAEAYLFGGPYSGQGYVNFNFAGPDELPPGAESYFMLLDTDATSYSEIATMDVANVGHTRISSLFTTWGPSNVPDRLPQISALAIPLMSLMLKRRLERN